MTELHVPTLGGDGYAVALCRHSPFPQASADDGKLYGMLGAAARDVKRWIDANGEGSDDPLFVSSRAFLALTVLAGPDHTASAKEALLAIVMIGTQAKSGASLPQAWMKARRHWESGRPNGESVFLGAEPVYEGDCNWGLSDELDGFVFGAEGLSQFPARLAGRLFVSSLATRLTVAAHNWNNTLAGGNVSAGRRPWLTSDGYYHGHASEIYEVPFVLGELV